MGNKQDVKRTLMAPTSARPVSGEPLSIELGTDEDVRWIWCHHGERGSSVIGYTIVPREPTDAPAPPEDGRDQADHHEKESQPHEQRRSDSFRWKKNGN